MNEENQNIKHGEADFNIRDRIEQGVILERLNNLIIENKEAHRKILEQTCRTNGIVADIQKWRNMINGALIMMNVFLVPIVLYLIYKSL